MGSTRTIAYRDGAEWDLRVVEISDLERRVSYEFFAAKPPPGFSSRLDTITLYRVSRTGATFLTWSSDFSADASVAVTEDSRLKKLEAFADLQRVFVSGGAAVASASAAAAVAAGAGAGSAGARDKERATKEKGGRIVSAGRIGGEFKETRDAEFIAARNVMLDRLVAEQEAELRAKPHNPIRVRHRP